MKISQIKNKFLLPVLTILLIATAGCKKEFFDKINKNSINPIKKLKPSNFSQKNKVSEYTQK